MPLRSPTPPALFGSGTPIAPGRLLAARNIALLRDRPRAPRSFGLRHRRRRIRPGTHRCEHFVDHLRRQTIHEVEIHLHAARSIARRKTLDLFIRKNSVVRRLELPDAELLPKIRHHIFGPINRTRQPPANLQHILPDRPPIEQRIKRNRRFNLGIRKSNMPPPHSSPPRCNTLRALETNA